jgi:hypothetical protein
LLISIVAVLIILGLFLAMLSSSPKPASRQLPDEDDLS